MHPRGEGVHPRVLCGRAGGWYIGIPDAAGRRTPMPETSRPETRRFPLLRDRQAYSHLKRSPPLACDAPPGLRVAAARPPRRAPADESERDPCRRSPRTPSGGSMAPRRPPAGPVVAAFPRCRPFRRRRRDCDAPRPRSRRLLFSSLSRRAALRRAAPRASRRSQNRTSVAECGRFAATLVTSCDTGDLTSRWRSLMPCRCAPATRHKTSPTGRAGSIL